MKTKQKWVVVPYNVEKISDHYLVSNYLGCWDILADEDFRKLNSFNLTEHTVLFERLLERGIVVKRDNVQKLISEFRRLNANLFTDTFLHIVVVTTRCNLACTYCQTKFPHEQDMNIDVASRILKYLFDTRNQYQTLEFQGGEPLLNWDVMKFFIESINKSSTSKSFTLLLVNNGTLLDDSKINYLLDNKVNICVSLDGPQHIHDKNRVFHSGKGSYSKVMATIERLKKIYGKRKLDRPVDLLLTVSRYSLDYPREIIDEYVRLGSAQIAIRPLNRIGAARESWDRIGYSPEDFNKFWETAVDYLLELNLKGINIRERLVGVMLKKILRKEDPGYVDLMNPCGAGRSVLAYMPNGDVYPCDEARMTGEEMFKLGNVMENEYENVIKSPNLLPISHASLVNLGDYNNAYFPWIGNCPVVNYMETGNLIPPTRCASLYKIFRFQFEYIFKKMVEDKRNEVIFQNWAR